MVVIFQLLHLKDDSKDVDKGYMTTHELVANFFFEVNLKTIVMFPFWIHLNPNQIVMNDSKFKCHVTYSLSMRCPIWTSIFLNKMLVSADCCTLMYYFQPWLKNVHRHWFFCVFLF